MEEIEIILTVPYEISINADGINLDEFECHFHIEDDGIEYSIPLKFKKDSYILNIPKKLHFLGGKSFDYKIYVSNESARFCASEGKLKIVSGESANFKVDIKPQKRDNSTQNGGNNKSQSKPDDKKDKETDKEEKKAEKEKTSSKSTDTVKESNNIITSNSYKLKDILSKTKEKREFEENLSKNKDQINEKVLKILKEFKDK